MRRTIESVKCGEIIVEGRTEIKVAKIEPYYCSSFGTHVNDRYCYPRGSIVRTKDEILELDEDLGYDFEESGLGDLPEDNLLSMLMGGLTQYLVRSE